MTTNNLHGIDEDLRNRLANLGEEVRDRRKRVREERLALREEREHVAIGASAVVQSINDADADLDEEEAQLGVILGEKRRPVDRPAEPERVEPVVVTEPERVEPVVVTEPERVEPVVVRPAPVFDADPPTARQPVAVVEERESWGGRVTGCTWPWVVALVVGLVVLVIMSHNYKHILSWAAGNAHWQKNGFVRFLFIVVPPLLAAYWAWIWAEDKLCRDRRVTT